MSRGADGLVQVERLVAAANPHGRQVEHVNRPRPQPRVPRLVCAMLRELPTRYGSRHVPNQAAQQQRTVKLALPVPVQPPVEATLLPHGRPPIRPCAAPSPVSRLDLLAHRDDGSELVLLGDGDFADDVQPDVRNDRAASWTFAASDGSR